jgi:starch synthase (maltosyl-transferring)
MKSLTMIHDILVSKKESFTGSYHVPSCWNCIEYDKYKTPEECPGEIDVNPYGFFASCIDNITKKKSDLRHIDSIKDNLIYSILPRSFTAWPHYRHDDLCEGTLLKALALLPFLKRLGVTILYLLPIFSCSDHYKKGELGSPYSIKDFYRIDRGLHDPLLGDYSEGMLETEFMAFVEACHVLDIKVIVDFAFRTTARDNVLIAGHPDWFFWIKKECADVFKTPVLGDGEESYSMNAATIRQLYKSPDLKKYLNQFSPSPDKIDQDKWETIKSSGCDDMDKAIENVFNITTVPGFSDVINDHQPAWTDVTYLRYYFDNPPEIQKHLPWDQPPYIMQDGASLTNSHGKVKNDELWQYIANVLPFYKMRFAIDGARIDMAHALPDELNALIVSKIKSAYPDFILWSEELNPENSGQAKASGFDFISGFTYADYKKVNCSGFNSAIIESLLQSDIPIVASLETPDTPRSAFVYQSTALLKLLLVLNSFMPNAIPMINSGQELFETQPMNLGLDNDENGRFVLSGSDPMYGKLAFFDRYCLHWANASSEFFDFLSEIVQIREKHISLLTDGEFIKHAELAHAKKLTVLHYKNADGTNLIVAANRSQDKKAVLNLEKLMDYQLNQECNILYNSNGECESEPESLKKILKPLETIILEIVQTR